MAGSERARQMGSGFGEAGLGWAAWRTGFRTWDFGQWILYNISPFFSIVTWMVSVNCPGLGWNCASVTCARRSRVPLEEVILLVTDAALYLLQV